MLFDIMLFVVEVHCDEVPVRNGCTNMQVRGACSKLQLRKRNKDMVIKSYVYLQ